MFLAFDLLHQDGVDLRALPLSERKRDLSRLCRKSRVPFLKQVETFPDGEVVFDHCNQFGFEGVVSKRLASPYSSGPSRNWIKTKCPGWKRINAGRHKLLRDRATPELTEAQKTRARKRLGLAKVIEMVCKRLGRVHVGDFGAVLKRAAEIGLKDDQLAQRYCNEALKPRTAVISAPQLASPPSCTLGARP